MDAVRIIYLTFQPDLSQWTSLEIDWSRHRDARRSSGAKEKGARLERYDKSRVKACDGNVHCAACGFHLVGHIVNTKNGIGASNFPGEGGLRVLRTPVISGRS